MSDYTIVCLETPQAYEAVEKIGENNGYCCCSIIKDEDTRCMCKDFRDKCNDPTFYGECNCGVYKKVKTEESENE